MWRLELQEGKAKGEQDKVWTQRSDWGKVNYMARCRVGEYKGCLVKEEVKLTDLSSLPALAPSGPEEERGVFLTGNEWLGWDCRDLATWDQPDDLLALHLKQSNSLPFSQARLGSGKETHA